MSYSLEGKIANQDPTHINCEKCFVPIEAPVAITVNSKSTSQMFFCKSYIGTQYYIYETKGGAAVVYCSEYCRNKHNHRFSK